MRTAAPGVDLLDGDRLGAAEKDVVQPVQIVAEANVCGFVQPKALVLRASAQDRGASGSCREKS